MQGQTVTGVSEHQLFDARVMSPFFNDKNLVMIWKKNPRVNVVKLEHDIATSQIWKKLCKDSGKFKTKSRIKRAGFESSIGHK